MNSFLFWINSIVGAENSWVEYGMALGIVGATMFFLWILKPMILSWVKRFSRRTENDFDDVICDVLEIMNWFLFFIVGLYVGGNFIEMRPFWREVSDKVALVVVVIYAVRALNKLVQYGLKKILYKGQEEPDAEAIMMEFILSKILVVLLWVIAFVVILQNMGFKVTALVGGLGIGGIAIAFALQNVLEDVFSYFSIYFDKPFKVGDFIVVGQESGTVEQIGIKTTRIKTLTGDELVFANKELTTAQVHNYKKLERRRISFVIGVVYETPVKQVKQIPGWIEKIIEKQDQASFDRAHFKEFGDFSLIFEVVYHVEASEFKVYMDTQQAINLALMEKFEKEGVEFAYPTQVIYSKK